MAEPFVTFQKSADTDFISELTDLFTKNGIEFKLEEPVVRDSSFPIDSNILNETIIKLKLADFEKADKLLTGIAQREIDIADEDYYLHAFTDEELIEVLAKPDEWNKYDYLLAKKLLKQRGREIDPDFLNIIRKQRIKELAKPEESRKAWIFFGYLTAPLGGIIAIFIGYNLAFHTKTLPTGEKIKAYSEADREHGIRIFAIGIIAAIVGIIIRIKMAY